MKLITKRKIEKSNKATGNAGFTLVEALVAALLMAFVLSGISKYSVSALTSSANQAERKRIEAAINNNIQLIQMQDSYLRLTDMDSDMARDKACSDPIETLSTHLAQNVPSPEPENVRNEIVRTFSPTVSNSAEVLTVNYKFYAPEHSGKADAMQHWEYRTIDLHPNFAAECYTRD